MTDVFQSEQLNIDDEPTYCAVHPDRETGLRCNRCERYMCGQCAVATPVGYRCKQCVYQVENRFYTAKQRDYAIIFLVTAVGAALLTLVLSFVSFFLLILFFGALIGGGAISELAWRAVSRRKGRYYKYAAWAGSTVGVLALMLLVFGGVSVFLLLYTALLAFMVGLRFQ
ncbi:MAG: hypothetical protein ACOCYT_05270 [Chloroflexota bacterium]